MSPQWKRPFFSLVFCIKNIPTIPLILQATNYKNVFLSYIIQVHTEYSPDQQGLTYLLSGPLQRNTHWPWCSRCLMDWSPLGSFVYLWLHLFSSSWTHKTLFKIYDHINTTTGFCYIYFASVDDKAYVWCTSSEYTTLPVLKASETFRYNVFSLSP